MNINLPKNLKTIYRWAFKDCINLYTIYIPKSVETIEYQVFMNCINLTINCEIDKKPDGWNRDWNKNTKAVNWGK